MAILWLMKLKYSSKGSQVEWTISIYVNIVVSPKHHTYHTCNTDVAQFVV